MHGGEGFCCEVESGLVVVGVNVRSVCGVSRAFRKDGRRCGDA